MYRLTIISAQSSDIKNLHDVVQPLPLFPELFHHPRNSVSIQQ